MTARRLRKDLKKLRRDSALATVAAVLRYPYVLKKRAAYRRAMELGDYADRFRAIYAKGLWHSRESGSGQGSELHYTETLRNWLPGIFETYGIGTVVDAACGDFNWMRHVVAETGIRYHGVDVVEPVIDRNRSRYGSDTTSFDVADICGDRLPKADLLLVRDCLFHLSNEDIGRFLANAVRQDYTYLLTSTHHVGDGFENDDIRSGDFRLFDLFRPPFRFDPAAVLERVDDFPAGYPIEREMVLFRKADVPTGLS